MNFNAHHFKKAIVILTAMLTIAPQAFAATNSETLVVPTFVAKRSIFILPSNSKEGRDPFFPASLRPYENAVVPVGTSTDMSALIIKGFSADSHGNRFVVINNHTFGVGDEGDVITSQGRIHLHCLGIKGNTVTIEVDGQRHELSYSANQ